MELKKTKDEIIKKAGELGSEYEAKYKGCSQSTFLTIIDALRWGGLEIINEDMERRLFPGICVLTAGVCMTGEGTCGAINSSVMIMGLALGMSLESQYGSVVHEDCTTIRKDFLDRYHREYGSILCKEIQRKFFGKAWDLTRVDMTQEFLGISKGCIIVQTASRATEIILDQFEKGNIALTA